MPKMIYLPVAHRHIDRYQEVADDLGEMLGLDGLAIWWNFTGWVLGIHHTEDPIEEVEALYAFETPDPACGGLQVTDQDFVNLREMLFDGPALSFDDFDSAERSKLEQFQAEQDETRDMRRWIGKRLGFDDPYWKPVV